jgi:BlaI family penicillinase repressor
MDKEIQKLPDGEFAVMQAIWACSVPAEREEIEKHLNPDHPIALTTLLTVLTRLAEKGFIQIEKNGRRSQYTPLISQQTYLSKQSRHFLDKLCGGSISTFASALCHSGLSREELEQLRLLLEEEAL